MQVKQMYNRIESSGLWQPLNFQIFKILLSYHEKAFKHLSPLTPHPSPPPPQENKLTL